MASTGYIDLTDFSGKLAVVLHEWKVLNFTESWLLSNLPYNCIVSCNNPVITRINVDRILWHHMTSLGLNPKSFICWSINTDLHFEAFLYTEISMSEYNHNKVRNEITHPFPNSNCYTVEAWERLSNFIPHVSQRMTIYPLNHVS